MKNHLKYVIASFALLACLGLGSSAQAENSTQPATAQQSESVKPPVGLLAWQRVGAPLSLEG